MNINSDDFALKIKLIENTFDVALKDVSYRSKEANMYLLLGLSWAFGDASYLCEDPEVSELLKSLGDLAQTFMVQIIGD